LYCTKSYTKNVKSPLVKQMAQFPHYRQLDSMDCGPTCLRMIARYYGKTYSSQYLRTRSYITRAGVSMLGISDSAESIGFRTKGYRLTWEQLRDEVPLPCIVHWNQRHFVVVYAIKKKGQNERSCYRGIGLKKSFSV
jgi:ATP-binding cassette subfamily B protein